VRDQDGRPLRAAAAVSPGMPLDIEFSDGRVRARTEGAGAGPQTADASAKPRQRRRDDKGQGSLFG